MAKTLFLAEKDEATYLAKVGEYLDGGLPDSYKDFAIAHREEGYAPVYVAYMVKTLQAKLNALIDNALLAR